MLKWQENVRPEIAIAVSRPPKSFGHNFTGFLASFTGPPKLFFTDLKIITPARKTTHATLKKKVSVKRWCTSHSVDKIRFLLGMLYRSCSPYLLWIQQRPESGVTIYFFTLNQGDSRRNTFLRIFSTWYCTGLCDIPFSFNWAEAFRCISLGVLPNFDCGPPLIHKVHWVIAFYLKLLHLTLTSVTP